MTWLCSSTSTYFASALMHAVRHARSVRAPADAFEWCEAPHRLSESRPVKVCCAAAGTLANSASVRIKNLEFGIWNARTNSKFSIPNSKFMWSLRRAQLFQQRDGARMGQLDRRLEAERISAGGGCGPSSAGGRFRHRLPPPPESPTS